MAHCELLRIRAALDDATDAIMIASPGGEALYLNLAFGYLFGYTLEMIKEVGMQGIYADQAVAKVATQAVLGGGTWRGETRLVSRSGRVFPAQLRESAILDDDFDLIGILLMCTDITELKKAEEERLQREKLEGVIEMAGAACHELNQPLQGISGYADLILMQLPPESPLRTDVAAMKAEALRMAAITRKLNQITRYAARDYAGGGKIIDVDRAVGESMAQSADAGPDCEEVIT